MKKLSLILALFFGLTFSACTKEDKDNDSDKDDKKTTTDTKSDKIVDEVDGYQKIESKDGEVTYILPESWEGSKDMYTSKDTETLGANFNLQVTTGVATTYTTSFCEKVADEAKKIFENAFDDVELLDVKLAQQDGKKACVINWKNEYMSTQMYQDQILFNSDGSQYTFTLTQVVDSSDDEIFDNLVKSIDFKS